MQILHRKKRTMYKYIAKRLLMIIPVVLFVSFVVFSVMELVPGDPAVTALGDEATVEQLEHYREVNGLNDPLPVRYVRYMAGILRKDLGTSVYNGEDVWDLYFSKLPYTLELALASVLLTIVTSIPLGILAAVKHNSLADTAASALSFVGLAMPNFWIGLLLIILFSVNLGWLPSNGADAGIKSIILPAITCGTGNMAALTRTTRSAMLDVMRQDYLRTARAKGVRESLVVARHAFRNAQIPIVTMIGTQCATLVGGALITERVFSWPGVGSYLVDSILKSDYEVVTGFIIVTTIIVSLILLLVDIIYAFMDPRIKAQYSRS